MSDPTVGEPGSERGVVHDVRLVVPAALDGERVDRGLSLLAGISRSEASRLVAEGRATLAGRTVRSGSRRLRGGEVLEAAVGAGQGAPVAQAFDGAAKPARPRAASSRQAEALVVFADADLVVVDKPAGLVVHPGAGNADGTLVQQLLALFPDIAGAGPDGDRPGIVHRLDKGTSGLLVVARSSVAREGLVRQMAGRTTERRYRAVVYGELEADEGEIDAPVGRSRSERVKMAVVHGGRHARTHYWTRARSTSPWPVSMVSCRLETGRTHQVRVHFAAIGHPVLADERYSGAGQLAATAVLLPELRRPWLHAEHLGFTHPVTGEQMAFSSALPEDLLASMVVLGLGSQR